MSTQPPISPSPLPTLDLLYDEIRARLQLASDQNSALESKASFVLGAASVLISAATGAQVAFGSRAARHFFIGLSGQFIYFPFSAADAIPWLTIIAAGIYLWVVIHAFQAYMVRKYLVFDPAILYLYIAPEYEE